MVMESLSSVINLPPGGQQPDGKIRVELAVNINKQDDLTKIEEALKTKVIKLLSSDIEAKTIQLELGHETNSELRNIQAVQRFIENQTGILTVVKGLGQQGSAVVELGPSSSISSEGQRVMGVVRLSQLTKGHCFVDGAISGFELDRKKTRHLTLSIHQFGDLSGRDFEMIGDPELDVDNHPVNDDKFHTMSIRKTISNCDVSTIIGKSMAVTEHTEEPIHKRVLSAGTIARASTIESNKKQICYCSGKTLWDERLEKKQSERD